MFPTKPKSKLTSTTFKVKEEVISNKETIAKGFGRFFSSIATTLLHSLNPIQDFVWNKPQNLPIRTTQKFSFRSITPSEICKCLKKLRRKKTHGIDELPPNLLKDAAYEISKSMAFIITNLHPRVQFQTSGKYQKLNHFINQIQIRLQKLPSNICFTTFFLKYSSKSSTVSFQIILQKFPKKQPVWIPSRTIYGNQPAIFQSMIYVRTLIMAY